MSLYVRDVKRFHDKFGLETPPVFVFLPEDLFKFRAAFFKEELQEYIDSCKQDDLATAIDSLIDLVYIVCGASLLHGIDVEPFHKMIDEVQTVDVYDLFESNEPDKQGPGFLLPDNEHKLVALMQKNIASYELAHSVRSEFGIKQALTELYLNSLLGASDMGVTQECWDEMWTDVQRANMSKVRAERASDSKRGSQWDVVKPKGWVPPQTEEILAKYVRA